MAFKILQFRYRNNQYPMFVRPLCHVGVWRYVLLCPTTQFKIQNISAPPCESLEHVRYFRYSKLVLIGRPLSLSLYLSLHTAPPPPPPRRYVTDKTMIAAGRLRKLIWSGRERDCGVRTTSTIARAPHTCTTLRPGVPRPHIKLQHYTVRCVCVHGRNPSG